MNPCTHVLVGLSSWSVCVCVNVSVCWTLTFGADTTNQTILRDSFALINNTKLPAFLCLLSNYTTLCNYTVTSISVCTTELHMLYYMYYTVDVPTYTVPDMITSVTGNTDFRLCCNRLPRQNQGFCLVLGALVRPRNTTANSLDWYALNFSLATDPTLSGENSVLRGR